MYTRRQGELDRYLQLDYTIFTARWYRYLQLDDTQQFGA